MKEKELEMQQAVLTMLQRAKDDPRIPQAAEQAKQMKARALRDALDEVCREMEEYAEEMKQKAEAARKEKPKAKDAKASSKDAKQNKKKPVQEATKEPVDGEMNDEDVEVGEAEQCGEDDWNPLKALTRRKPARRLAEFKEASWAKVERLVRGLKGRGVKLRDLRLLTVKEREKLLKEHLGHPSGELPASTEGNGKKEPPTVPLASACPTDLDTFIQWLCEQLWLARIQRLSTPERRIERKRPPQAGRPQKTLSARVGGGFIYETFQAPADFEEEPHSPAEASGPLRRRTPTRQAQSRERESTISARVGGGFIYKTFQEGDCDNGGDLRRHTEDSPLDRVRKLVEEAAILESDPKSLTRLVQMLSNSGMQLDALLCLPQEEFRRVAELLCVNMHGLTKDDVVEKLKMRVWANRTKFAKIKGLSKLAFEPKSQVLAELRKALREAEEQLQRPVTAFQLSGWLAQYQLEYYQLQINNLSLLTVAELRHLGGWMGMPPKKSRAEILEWFQQDLWSERAVRRTPSKARTQFLRELSTVRRRSADEESAEAEENQDDEADADEPTLSAILLDDPDFRDRKSVV